jgi:sec-independent protein translocase protein TatA
MGMPGGTELLIIFGIVILLFGAKKIPELAKGLGKGIKNFKSEMKDDSTQSVSTKTTKKIEDDTSETTKQA